MIAQAAYKPVSMIVQKLDTRMKKWTPEVAARVEILVDEIMTLADQDCLDVLRTRTVEQEVLNILDET